MSALPTPLASPVPAPTADAVLPPGEAAQPPASHQRSGIAALTIGAIGIVYGDIGTSPLYTMKEIFAPEHGVALNQANLLGVVSLILWGLTIIVTLKYIILIMRADNHGEGGIIALLALALSSIARRSGWAFPLTLIGLTGAALFFGDGVITPAISVLSAVEGLEVATPALKAYVVPLTICVLIGLYLVQYKGTAGIGAWFGPIVIVWFAALAAMGVLNVLQRPEILAAINPVHAIGFLTRNGWIAFAALGSIVLAFTGAEALYADMGHFGARPIRLAWTFIVFPALACSYLGQGALLLANPAAISNPFYQQLGPWSVYPLVALSTIATVIASQATISGTFSIVQQAISLGFLPRMRVLYTSSKEIGQIYIPLVNWIQLLAVILAVIGFGSSSGLASAYGIAVTATMLTTTFLTFFVIRYKWKIPLLLCLAATGFFMLVDLAFFSANLLKIVSGGWFPILLGAIMLTIMLTWRSGRRLVAQSRHEDMISLPEFLTSLMSDAVTRVEGTAVFFRGEGDGVPHALLHNLVHNKVLHERIVFITVINDDVPFVSTAQRVEIEALGHACYQVTLRFGFQEQRDIPAALALCAAKHVPFDMMATSFFISRQTVIPTRGEGMTTWRESLYATMARNARDAAGYFQLPSNRVIELGSQVQI